MIQKKDTSHLSLHGETFINSENYTVWKQIKGNKTVSSVFVNFSGKFPKTYIQHLDANLPTRLFSNAKFVIKCNTKDLDTITYLRKLYANKSLKFVDDKDIYTTDFYNDYEVLYCPWIGNSKFSTDITLSELRFHKSIFNFKGDVYIMFNELSLPTYKNIEDVLLERINECPKYLDKCKYGKELESFLLQKPKYKSLTIGIRNNIMDIGGYWWNMNKMKKISFNPNNSHKFNIEIISDKLNYEMPDEQSLKFKNRQKNELCGVWVGTCFPERVQLLEKIFSERIKNLNLLIRGVNSETIKSPYKPTIGKITSEHVAELYEQGDYGIYIARGKYINFAGQSLYEPIIHGKPVFIYNDIDPNHLLMPDIDECYFNDAQDLVNKIYSVNLENLYYTQRKSLYKRL